MPVRNMPLAEGAVSGNIHSGRHGTISFIPLSAPRLLIVFHLRLRGGKSELQLLFLRDPLSPLSLSDGKCLAWH